MVEGVSFSNALFQICFSSIQTSHRNENKVEKNLRLKSPGGGGRGRGLPYITDGDARRNFQKKPLKVTILGVTLASFIP